ncbi:hypothetical protein CJF32_00001269 [Rutstroemia sp. NJR-2017a WRK4]|nr:hypothetical protein CJF32_00001269 [Rutstroemia sp. NJR-2017a WRK4]
MYEYSQHFLPGAEKPQLTRQIRQMRVQLAVYLLKYDLKTIVFIDQANARTEYGKERCWYDPDEYFDSDVVQQSTKQSYQKAEFMAAIKWGEPPGPYIVLKKETLEEENAAEAIMQKYRADQEAHLRVKFDAQEAAKDAQRIGNRKGRPAIFEAFKKAHSIGRGKKGSGGIDWFRLCEKYVVPLLKPWLDKLQEKEDQRRSTRRHPGGIQGLKNYLKRS